MSLGKRGKAYPAPPNATRVRAKAPTANVRGTRYDATSPNNPNARHFAARDGLSAANSLTPHVRKMLREIARYEIGNNSYAAGMTSTLANDVIGTGPRLQMLTLDTVANAKIEAAFSLWMAETNLATKLRTIKTSKTSDGEGFGAMFNNDGLDSPIKLDLSTIETERVSSGVNGTDPWDGIVTNGQGIVTGYKVLPTDQSASNGLGDNPITVPARLMVQAFNRFRPGQLRGLSEITPALGLFAQLRRFTTATLTSAETAASMALWMKSTSLEQDSPVPLDPGDIFDLVQGMVTTLPEGWDIGQLRPEQPSTGYKEFKREILNEIARCLNMPYNIAAGDSSDYNFASGRLDHQMYFKAIDVERSQWELDVMDKLFREWMREAALASFADIVPPTLRNPATWVHAWHWAGREHIDPAKQATAWKTELEARTTTFAAVYASKGLDWSNQFAQMAKEDKLLADLGISREKAAKQAAQPAAPAPQEPDE